MNQELARLALHAGLGEPGREGLGLAFGLACANRVRHLLEDPQAIGCLEVLQAFVAGATGAQELALARDRIAAVANGHRGSHSIDGSQHAAVSATYAVANALAGRALDAAGYSAYATVYAYAGYAVNDPGAFEPEFAWQVAEFNRQAALSETARAAA